MRNRFWEHRWLIWGVYTLAGLAVTIQKLVLTAQEAATATPGVFKPTAYENYVIFKLSFAHLIAETNIYAGFPSEQWDLYKYSPAFALCMEPFYLLPDTVGLLLWSLLNALLPLYALLHLPVLTEKQKVFCAWFIFPELLVSLQNCQSNSLTLGLLLLACIAFERGLLVRAALWITGAAFIKIFGIAAAALALLYPKPGKFALEIAGWILIFALAPILAVSPGYFWQVYVWWGELLRTDHAASLGLSVHGWLESWFGLRPNKLLITVLGLGLFVASTIAGTTRPLFDRLFSRSGRNEPAESVRFRAISWASLLLWVVLFNHKAESPTFVIAMCGAAIWYVNSEKRRWETILLWTAFVFSSLSPTDIFPRMLREQIVQPYVLKAVPMILIWGVITYQLFTWKKIGQAETHA
jgi:hypothetical protein